MCIWNKTKWGKSQINICTGINTITFFAVINKNQEICLVSHVYNKLLVFFYEKKFNV